MKIYLAGPMRGYKNFNHLAFREAAAKLRAQGHEVFSPVEHTEEIYGPGLYENNPHGDELRAGIDSRKVFGADLAWICAEAEAIALLPGWKGSRGARAERAAADALGLQIIELGDRPPNVLEFNTLSAANAARNVEWDPGSQIDLSFRAVELAGEVGEACNVVKKLERERMGLRGSRDTLDHLAEEVADVVICAHLMAMTAGFDLDAAVRAKFNATSEKQGLKTRLVA